MAEPRHLAIFIRSLGGGGGAERMMVTLADAFARRGHRVDLVLGRVEGNFFEDLPESVRLVDLGGGSLPATAAQLLRRPGEAGRLLPAFFRAPPPWILLCIPALMDYLQEQRPDAMLSALNYTNLAALLARRWSGVPTRLVVSERNTLSVRAARGSQARLRALPALVRRLYPEADAIAAVSDGVREDLVRVTGLPPERIRTTYNPVVGPEIPERAAAALAHPWFAEGAPPVILAAGKLKPQKGFLTLLEAFAQLHSERPARLVILGEGPQRRELERRVLQLGLGEDVALPGFQRNPFAWMARSRAFALSSVWEGLPGVLIQAMACGCPVVATDCPSGPAEILDGGRYGPLVPVGDAPALARALSSVLDAPPPPEFLRTRAQLFSVERSTDRYLALLLP